jgi:hypothetical protein
MSEIQKTNSSLDERINEPEFRDLVQQHHAIVGDRVTGYMTNNFTLIERFFTKKNLVKLMDDAKLKEAQTEIAFRHRTLELATTFKYKVLEEKYDNWLRVVRTEYRTQFTLFVTEKRKQLDEVFLEKRATFMQDIAREYDLNAQYQHIPNLAQNHLKSIEKRTNDYFAWLDKLLDNFMDIVDAKVLELKK